MIVVQTLKIIYRVIEKDVVVVIAFEVGTNIVAANAIPINKIVESA